MTSSLPAAPAAPARVLVVKLSSLGDVIHTLPVAVDVQRALGPVQIDWVVERGFAPLVRRCSAVSRVIEVDLRRWRRQWWSAQTRAQWRAFLQDLQHTPYDAVLDLQGLTKSALVSRLARLSPTGKRYAMANRTEGSGYEAPTRWVADVTIGLLPRLHALTRGREVAARALGYTPLHQIGYGLGQASATAPREVALVHGTSRADKHWPDTHWVALAQRLQDAGWASVLPHGNDAELARAHALAQAINQHPGPAARVLPRLDLAGLVDAFTQCAGVIGVDSGLSHLAVALDLPHVQIYNFDTAWRTGPIGCAYQQPVFAHPTPSMQAVWDTWQGCWQAHADLAMKAGH